MIYQDFIFCTRKIECFESSKHNAISVRTYKKYYKSLFEEHLTKMKFPNHELFSGAESACNHLSKILQETINEIAPIKDILIKGNTRSWFDSNIRESIRKRGKLKKRFLHTKLHVDYEYFKEQRNIVQREVKRKKQLQKNTNITKERWKALKNLDMPCKVFHQLKTCLREKSLVTI